MCSQLCAGAEWLQELGLSAGITYILNGDLEDISGAMMNMVGSISGMICDGAKSGCALKLALASGWAVECSILSMNKTVINSTDGIVNSDFRKLFRQSGSSVLYMRIAAESGNCQNS